jgi:DsbC/DsbD-like thiol-disulfide interchange protein
MNNLAWLLLLPVIIPGDAAIPRNDPSLSLRPVRWTVVGGSAPRDVVSGRTVPITVQADIAKGWHIYSLTQKPGGPIPLRLEVVGAADVVVRGVIDAPKPERIFDQNFGFETELYSGRPQFTIPVGVRGRSAAGVRKFQIGARYQVCSDKVCLPSRVDKLDVAIRIAGRK